MLWTAGDHAGAVDCFLKAAAVLERSEGPDSPELARTYEFLATHCIESGLHSSACRIPPPRRIVGCGAFAMAPFILPFLFLKPPPSPFLCVWLCALSPHTCGAAVAVQLLSRILYIREVVGGPNHVETVSVMVRTAKVLNASKVYPLASALFKAGLQRNARSLKLTLACIEGLAESCVGLGSFKEAIDLSRRRFEIVR